MSKLKDSGERTHFDSGARRDMQQGKGAFHLLPVRAMKALARLFENGALKYENRNWEKGVPLSSFANSGIRHGFQALAKEHDEEHPIHSAWNMLCFYETQCRIAEGLLPADLDDLPDQTPVRIPADKWIVKKEET